MQRIGVHFHKLPPALQARLDRWVFDQMRSLAWERRHARGLPTRPFPGAHERRGAHRVPTKEFRVVTGKAEEERPPSLKEQALIVAGQAGQVSYELRDLSTTGCCFMAPDEASFHAGQTLRLRLMDGEKELEVTGQIVHVQHLR